MSGLSAINVRYLQNYSMRAESYNTKVANALKAKIMLLMASYLFLMARLDDAVLYGCGDMKKDGDKRKIIVTYFAALLATISTEKRSIYFRRAKEYKSPKFRRHDIEPRRVDFSEKCYNIF